ncbi:helix-turn-helix domain-containing protein [Limosilactobacillus ingluviei]|uniref:helix-turn-helix domain-containing protein n=1 Tax=Limosilactobacillus ingluviei TaxID=148604 RepID=UPI0024BACC86|nr:helix-turn-helix transcriptional regulator [Limosilactobacillus ingluviei]
MTTYDNIKRFAKSKGISLQELAEKVGLSRNMIYQYKNVNPKLETLKKIAAVLGVDTSELVDDDQTNTAYYELNKKEKADIAVQAEKLIEGLESGAEVNFYGEPATDEQKNRLLIAIQTAMEMNKQEAKKKFTPKKYRD